MRKELILESGALDHSAILTRVSEDARLRNMYRFAKAAFNVTGQAVRQVRHGSTASAEFHSKYGNGLMVSGAVFCTAVWAYVLTQTGITWNLSPVGKVMPKEWREAEEE
ncbi:cytochrome c oxidase subunit 7B, mitochondrial-like protein [Lates japonicus]|uniref:Cytochrome c oxidase subunit 7B, mitochondrial n=1 Tax=Lates japonicus TaxID=270547 RepID=A0AAD3M394_LATJO|nr:cytochrome c oxidase subunit 7B, mitochondrial-like protein [Lates japonicus]